MLQGATSVSTSCGGLEEGTPRSWSWSCSQSRHALWRRVVSSRVCRLLRIELNVSVCWCVCVSGVCEVC